MIFLSFFIKSKSNLIVQAKIHAGLLPRRQCGFSTRLWRKYLKNFVPYILTFLFAKCDSLPCKGLHVNFLKLRTVWFKEFIQRLFFCCCFDHINLAAYLDCLYQMAQARQLLVQVRKVKIQTRQKSPGCGAVSFQDLSAIFTGSCSGSEGSVLCSKSSVTCWCSTLIS